MARLRHCIHKPMPASHDRHHERGNREELPLDTDLPAALWILISKLRKDVLHLFEIGVEGQLWSTQDEWGVGWRGVGRWGIRCILVLLLWMSGIIKVIVYVSHAQKQSLFLLLHNINDTAQACHTACTSEASALDYRGPATTLHRSLEAMPAVSGFSINSDGIY